MPKMKTKSGAAKRFRVRGSGSIKRYQAGKRHILEKKSSRVTRRMSGTAVVSENDAPRIKKLLGN